MNGLERRKDRGRPQLLLTLEEAADQLAVSRGTVYSLIRRGELVSVHPAPGAHRVTQASVVALVSRLTAAG